MGSATRIPDSFFAQRTNYGHDAYRYTVASTANNDDPYHSMSPGNDSLGIDSFAAGAEWNVKVGRQPAKVSVRPLIWHCRAIHRSRRRANMVPVTLVPKAPLVSMRGIARSAGPISKMYLLLVGAKQIKGAEGAFALSGAYPPFLSGGGQGLDWC